MKSRSRETLRMLGEFVLMVVLTLAVLELLVLGTAKAAASAKQLRNSEPSPHQSAARTASPQGEAMDGADVGRLRGENPTLISQPLADSFPLKGEAVGAVENEYPETGRNDLDELRGFDGVVRECTVTYYCCEKRAHICGGGTGKTASGTDVTAGRSAAVDPDVIPLGAEIFVDYGDGVLHSYIAEDTGSAVLGGHVDLAVATHEEALELGVREATVWWTE